MRVDWGTGEGLAAIVARTKLPISVEFFPGIDDRWLITSRLGPTLCYHKDYAARAYLRVADRLLPAPTPEPSGVPSRAASRLALPAAEVA